MHMPYYVRYILDTNESYEISLWLQYDLSQMRTSDYDEF